MKSLLLVIVVSLGANWGRSLTRPAFPESHMLYPSFPACSLLSTDLLFGHSSSASEYTAFRFFPLAVSTFWIYQYNSYFCSNDPAPTIYVFVYDVNASFSLVLASLSCRRVVHYIYLLCP